MKSELWIAVIVAGCGMIFSACRKSSEEAALPSVGGAPPPSQELKDFEINDVSNGEKTMTLQSDEGRIYEAQHYADVDKPFLLFYKNDKVSSRLRAPEGRIDTETHAVEAWGGVTVVSADSTTLTTDRLHYDPQTRKIYSDDPVRLEKPDSITDGVGLVTDPELQKVKIGHQTVHFKKGMS